MKKDKCFGFQRSAHAVGQNCFHLVWVTKYRLPVFRVTEFAGACEAIIRLVAWRQGMTIYELKVMDEHVHCFVQFPPRMSLASVFHRLKGVSSFMLRKRFPWLRKKFPDGSLWSPSKFYRSVGNVSADTIAHYIKYSNKRWEYFAETKRKDVAQRTLI